MNPIRQAMKWTLACVLPSHQFLVRGPRRRQTDITRIALTFDDGPHPKHTPQVLDALAEVRWQATFFLVGEQALAYPALMRRIVAEGHLIGNHTWTHSEPRQTSVEQFLAEVERTRAFMADLTGVSTPFVRPPKGALTWEKLSGLRQRNETTVLWNVDPKDYQMTSERELCRWTALYPPREGDIVLLHDRLPWAALAVRELAARHPRELRSVRLDHWFPERSCRANRDTETSTAKPVATMPSGEPAASLFARIC